MEESQAFITVRNSECATDFRIITRILGALHIHVHDYTIIPRAGAVVVINAGLAQARPNGG